MKNIFSILAILSMSSVFAQNPETTIGGTTFDLQSNGSNQKRIINHGDGTVSVCWMMSHNDNKNPADRGTGYNYYNGSSWIYNADDVVTRLESKKTGWPNLVKTKSGKEIIFAHSSVDTALIQLTRNTKGTGAWTQKNLFPGYKLLWCRAIAAGADGNTIHLIAVTAGVKEKAPKFKGIDGALLYAKSTDGGVNWSTPDLIPGIDSTFSLSISGDSYSIDAKGDTVAVLIGDSWSDVVLMKSTDNGNYWTKKLIYDFPYTLFDEKTTLTPDTPKTSDGFTEVLLDKSGKAHVWYGNMRVLNSKINDDSLSFFPASNGLMYWNETELFPQVIAQALDQDGDFAISPAKNINYEFPVYNCGLASMASAGIDDAGVIYVVYSAFMENFKSFGLQNYRHLYAIKSENGGSSWSYPNDITPSGLDSLREYTYPSLARKVDSYLHIVALEDDEPGLAVSSESDPFNISNVMYLKVSTALNVAVKEIASSNNSLSIFPNPVSDHQVQVSFQLEKSAQVQINVYDVLGKKISTQSFGKKEAGFNQLTLITELTPGMYLLEINAGGEKMTKQLVVK
ncbi:MAG: T9SS type A sorting domain-containing protein [Bacteroidetes bacterium]|nr:T9SS type A sorting domain-containing protein [Bacteroidota bacterium]